jgi:hypothetical protein
MTAAFFKAVICAHGARAVLRVAERKTSFAGSWLAGVMGGATTT